MQAFAFQVFVQINVGYESKKFLIVKAVSCLLEVLLLMSSSSSSSSKDVESSGTLGHLLLHLHIWRIFEDSSNKQPWHFQKFFFSLKAF